MEQYRAYRTSDRAWTRFEFSFIRVFYHCILDWTPEENTDSSEGEEDDTFSQVKPQPCSTLAPPLVTKLDLL